MAENTKRSVFGFHGVFGVLISIVGLLLIWAILMSQAVIVQQKAAKDPYDPAPIRDVNNLKMISVDNKDFAFQKKDN
ncbi:MAG: DUF4006 domain-containing protein [uncultured Sulfurovum sp.]|uniref:DUF4006 domain-containing protein n=1 Tax=uncultured Sulfurovum sp. TaxID=269237 RepID=A0A6S6SYI7_9BACT|nr:MAG: DUF4006 domain-containing protein [uncultured Sulfurovum sp.]